MQQQRPVIPNDDDHPLQDDLDDLQFMTSVDSTVRQNVEMDPEKARSNMEQMEQTSEHQQEQQQMIGTGPMGSNENGKSWEARQQSIVEYIQSSRAGQVLKDSSHPIAAIFHVLFKSLALFVYFFGGWFARSSNFVAITVICIVLLSLDFWVVKNITGRLLVGLRWWNKVNDDGTTKWIFESAEKQYENKIDNTIFWSVTYGTPIVWFIFLIVGVLKFELGWLLVVFVALVLNCSNVYGYWKCSSDQKAKFQSMVMRGAEMGAAAAIRNNVIGTISQIARSRQQQPQHTTHVHPSTNFV